MARLSLNRRWTSEDEALLARLLEEGKNWAVISVRLKRSIASVQFHADLRRTRLAFRRLGTDQAEPTPET